ncbi:MAG: hypothetical protein AABX13_04800 [Nanoarchaeota archaeon]
MMKKLVRYSALAAATFLSPIYSLATPVPAECLVSTAYQGEGEKQEEQKESEEQKKDEKGNLERAIEERTIEGERTAGEERTAGRASITSLSRDTTVRDLTFRFRTEYSPLSIKGTETDQSQVSYNQQRLDVSLNLGMDFYLVLGAGMTSKDPATSANVPANFASQRDNVRLGVGYEINSGYRAEGEAILVRHAGEFQPGVRTKLIGDLFWAESGPVRGVDFQVGVNLIKSEPITSTGPQLASQLGAKFAGGQFFQSYYARLATLLASGEGQMSFETGACRDFSWLKGCLGTEFFYHRSGEVEERGALTKLSVDVERLPYRR